MGLNPAWDKILSLHNTVISPTPFCGTEACCCCVLRPFDTFHVISGMVLTYPHCSWASLLGSLPVLSAHSFASNWQLPFLNQWKGENGCRNYFMTKLHERMLPDVRIEPTAVRMPGTRSWASYRAYRAQHWSLYDWKACVTEALLKQSAVKFSVIKQRSKSWRPFKHSVLPAWFWIHADVGYLQVLLIS